MDTSIHNHLLPGEEILWEDTPHLNGKFNSGSVGVSVFGIIWLSFSLFWTIMAFTMTRGETGFFGILFPLFGLPFVAIGLFLVFFAPAKQRAKNQSTYYYVTNKRLIVNIDTQKSPTFNSMFYRDIKGVQIIQNRDNTGNIVFTPTLGITAAYSNTSVSIPSADNCFYRVENANDVHKLILMHQQLDDLKNNT